MTCFPATPLLLPLASSFTPVRLSSFPSSRSTILRTISAHFSLESVVAVGVPAVIVLTLLFLPFFDRKSTRSFSRRPIARIVLILMLGSTAMLLGAALAEPPANPSTSCAVE